MPVSCIAAASEPASGLVRPKHGISRPSASRGSQYCCCSRVPNFISSSPGPSEFGTMMVTAPAIERVETLRTTSECAKLEKPSPPYSFGMIMPKKRFCLMKVPDLGRQVAQFPVDLPVVEHGAELLDRAVEEGLLLRRELRLRRRQKLRPVGLAGEQVGVPPHVARLQRLALGVGHRRQRLARPVEDGA